MEENNLDKINEAELRNIVLNALANRAKDVLLDELALAVWGEEVYAQKQKEIAQKVYDEFKEENSKKQEEVK